MTERKLMTIAAAVSVLAHALVVVLTWNLPLQAEPEPWHDPADESEIEVTLLPDEAVETRAEQPSTYVAIPERLAVPTAPEDPAFLALHNARAADLLAGGDASRNPAVDELAEVDQVAIRKEELSGSEGVEFAPAMTLQEASPEQPSRRGAEQQTATPTPEAEATGQQADPRGQWTLDEGGPQVDRDEQTGTEKAERPDGQQSPDWIAGQPPSILKPGRQGQVGDRGFDFQHRATSTVAGNVAVTGAFSLSSYEWNYAPWMHRFEKDLRRHWMAPYAYMIGVISGMTKIRIVVARSGQLTSLEVLEGEGHESLHKASEAALQAFAPYAPLPPGYPDENLVITYSLYYPAWKR